MKCLSKAAFLDADDLQTERAELPPELYGDGACVYVRVMGGVERGELEKEWAGREPSDDPSAWRAAMLILCVTDENGDMMFEEADRDRLMGKNGRVLESLVERAMDLNGYSAKSVKALEKNSESSPAS